MVITLKVDNRENIIIPALETACHAIDGVLLYVENMELGDAGIYDDNGKELLLFERKSLVDLSSSIRDGRYSEQSLRLKNQELANHNVVYIIEGSMEQYKNNPRFKSIHYKTLMSAMVSLNYFKGFSVVRTWNTLETIDLIMSYVAKILKTKPNLRNGFYSRINEKPQTNKINLLENETTDTTDTIKTIANDDAYNENYVSVIKRAKKENITINNILTIMLCQIPGISAISAEAITMKYPTMEKLVEACKEGKSAFDKLRHKSSNRRLSSHSINNLIKYVLCNKPQNIKLSVNIN
jgi:ERCC4-type nuclease